MSVLIVLFCGICGAILEGEDGLLVGVLFGVFFSVIWWKGRVRDQKIELLHGRIDRLRGELGEISQRQEEQARAAVGDPQSEVESTALEPELKEAVEGSALDKPLPPVIPVEKEVPQKGAEARVPAAKKVTAVSSPGQPSRLESAVKEFFLGGNTVVRVGMLVLLVGVAMLLKYAIDNQYLSEEARLAGSAFIGLALIVFGFRQRISRPGFAHTLQGGGLAALYFTIVFGMKVYGLIPLSAGFVLLAFIAGLGGALAVLQNSLPLIVIAILGGFMAPIITSGVSGNQVVLFSYYLLLNVSILGVAWFKPWRALNLLGFVFTFGVATVWGVLRYDPDRLAMTEPFLVAFSLLYFSVPILLADRLPGPRRGWVDGSLVFGTPLAFLGFQHKLISDQPWGMAFTTLLAAVLYLGVGRWLLSSKGKAMRPMFEAFFAVGVGFVTLAIPYALGNIALTGAAWSIEGAGLYWMGVRQKRAIARMAGALLQVLGGGGFLYSANSEYGFGRSFWRQFDGESWTGAGLLEGPFVGGLLVAVSAFFVARYAWRHRADLFGGEGNILQYLIIWGLGIWAVNVGWLIGIYCRGANNEPGVSLAVAATTVLLMELAGRKLGWLPGRIPAAATLLALPVLVLAWAGGIGNFLQQGGWLGWPLYLFTGLVSLRRFVPDAPKPVIFLHPVSFWGFTLFACVAIGLYAKNVAHLDDSWSVSLGGMAGAAALGLLLRGYRNKHWPVSAAPDLYLGLAAGGLVAALSVWFLFTVGLDGSAQPLPFIPLVNPVDLAQLGFILAVFGWVRALGRSSTKPKAGRVEHPARPHRKL
ncbi:MAG: DUF2339 domain-containing protein, partial [Planctomycetota bacterium]|nr:DUF2339 domain-containing protein [Planctomycetota bacterium]